MQKKNIKISETPPPSWLFCRVKIVKLFLHWNRNAEPWRIEATPSTVEFVEFRTNCNLKPTMLCWKIKYATWSNYFKMFRPGSHIMNQLGQFQLMHHPSISLLLPFILHSTPTSNFAVGWGALFLCCLIDFDFCSSRKFRKVPRNRAFKAMKNLNNFLGLSFWNFLQKST